LKVAAKSAFDWEAHASAFTTHFENLLEDLHYKNLTLTDSLEESTKEINALKEQYRQLQKSMKDTRNDGRNNIIPSKYNESNHTTEVTKELSKKSSISSNSNQTIVPFASSLNQNNTDKQRLIKIAKSWRKACENAWDHNLLRHYFDQFVMFLLREHMKKKDQTIMTLQHQVESNRIDSLMKYCIENQLQYEKWEMIAQRHHAEHYPNTSNSLIMVSVES
jgi:hypothetical protein